MDCLEKKSKADTSSGAGIIGQPYALKNAGLITGTVLLIALTVMVDWTICLIVINSKLSGTDSFQATVQHCFGKSGLVAISLAQWLLYVVAFRWLKSRGTDPSQCLRRHDGVLRNHWRYNTPGHGPSLSLLGGHAFSLATHKQKSRDDSVNFGHLISAFPLPRHLQGNDSYQPKATSQLTYNSLPKPVDSPLSA